MEVRALSIATRFAFLPTGGRSYQASAERRLPRNGHFRGRAVRRSIANLRGVWETVGVAKAKQPRRFPEDGLPPESEVRQIMGLKAIASVPIAPEPTSAMTAEGVNRERFEEYLRRFRKQIYVFVNQMVRDTHLAEDITQETFVRLFREISSIRDETASAWVYRVARNLVTDYKRKKRPVLFTVLKGRNGDSDDDDGSPDFEGGGLGPDQRSYENELRVALDSVLARMSAKYRDPLLLCDVERMTYEQAAQVLGCSVKTVSARLHRAREFVSQCMKKYLSSGE